MSSPSNLKLAINCVDSASPWKTPARALLEWPPSELVRSDVLSPLLVVFCRKGIAVLAVFLLVSSDEFEASFGFDGGANGVTLFESSDVEPPVGLGAAGVFVVFVV